VGRPIALPRRHFKYLLRIHSTALVSTAFRSIARSACFSLFDRIAKINGHSQEEVADVWTETVRAK
jgi:hypothetical protein